MKNKEIETEDKYPSLGQLTWLYIFMSCITLYIFDTKDDFLSSEAKKILFFIILALIFLLICVIIKKMRQNYSNFCRFITRLSERIFNMSYKLRRFLLNYKIDKKYDSFVFWIPIIATIGIFYKPLQLKFYPDLPWIFILCEKMILIFCTICASLIGLKRSIYSVRKFFAENLFNIAVLSFYVILNFYEINIFTISNYGTAIFFIFYVIFWLIFGVCGVFSALVVVPEVSRMTCSIINTSIAILTVSLNFIAMVAKQYNFGLAEKEIEVLELFGYTPSEFFQLAVNFMLIPIILTNLLAILFLDYRDYKIKLKRRLKFRERKRKRKK